VELENAESEVLGAYATKSSTLSPFVSKERAPYPLKKKLNDVSL
jgi:hypothetical protein